MFQIGHKRKSYLDQVLDKIVSFGTIFMFISSLNKINRSFRANRSADSAPRFSGNKDFINKSRYRSEKSSLRFA